MSKVFITDYIENPNIEREILKKDLALSFNDQIEVLLVWHQHITKKYIDKLPNLKGIIRYGVGYDAVDLKYAKSKEIYVCNTPDYGTEEVSDTAIAMILNIARGIFRYNYQSKFHFDSWQENVIKNLKRNSDYKIGVIGAGRIGSSILLKAKSLRFQTFFYDPYVVRGHEKTLDSIRLESLNELLEISDIISINCPLTHETRGMVDENFISKMKKGASLVNTARGGIVKDIDVFYIPLKTGKLSSVALDVLPNEPPRESPLIKSWKKNSKWLEGKLIINPHTAYYSDKSFVEMRQKAAENAKRILDLKSPYNIVN